MMRREIIQEDRMWEDGMWEERMWWERMNSARGAGGEIGRTFPYPIAHTLLYTILIISLVPYLFHTNSTHVICRNAASIVSHPHSLSPYLSRSPSHSPSLCQGRSHSPHCWSIIHTPQCNPHALARAVVTYRPAGRRGGTRELSEGGHGCVRVRVRILCPKWSFFGRARVWNVSTCVTMMKSGVSKRNLTLWKEVLLFACVAKMIDLSGLGWSDCYSASLSDLPTSLARYVPTPSTPKLSPSVSKAFGCFLEHLVVYVDLWLWWFLRLISSR